MARRVSGHTSDVTNDRWRTVAFGLAILLIVVVGFAVAQAIAPGSPGPTGSAGPSATTAGPTPTAAGSPSLGPTTAPTVPPSEAVPPSATVGPPPSVAPSTTPTGAPTAGPSASVPPSSPGPSATGPVPAVVTIRGLKVDAGDDAAGRDRRLTFKTEDPAMVFVKVEGLAPKASVDACLLLNDAELFCTSGPTFQMSGHTSRPNGTWTVTLRGTGSATPSMDVRLEFPSDSPAVTISGAWFDGAARPAYNGLAVELVPAVGPEVSATATWEGSQSYRLSVQPSGGTALTFEGTGSGVDRDVPVAAGLLQRIELRNIGAGAAHIALTATVAWH
jgi:hypothetical protein